MRRRSSGPTAATAAPRRGARAVPRHSVRPALAERYGGHRLLGQPERRRRTACGTASRWLALTRWRPPSYWFAGRYPATRGASAEQGDNEHIPPFASLKRFIPADKLWPINDTWYFHAGSDDNNEQLDNIRTAVDRRYGPSRQREEFARKAQLAHYESTRAQFEAFAAGGWDTHKMTIYWMLNNHWPSFFGNLFDYYLRPGGAYYGAKKGLQPLSVVFDSYATGDHSQANDHRRQPVRRRPGRSAGAGVGDCRHIRNVGHRVGAPTASSLSSPACTWPCTACKSSTA